jgi:peptidoglycan/LPS O-acetylase OafA/YrhL
MTKLQSLIHQFNLHPKKLFLTDSLGALLTAFLLVALLVTFNEQFSMPLNILYVLATVACAFAGYSMCCYLFVGNKWKQYLRFIAIANLLYCCATLALVVYFYQNLTALGVIYFLAEIAVVSLLAMIEFKTISYNPDITKF